MPQIEQLNWSDAVYTRLCDAVDRAVGGTERPVAVFDFDNTCIFRDIGELFSHYLIDEIGYRYELDAFWQLIDPRDGREHIRELTETLLAMPVDERRTSDVYEQYLAEMGAIYARKYVREGAAPCYEWAVRLHVGMTPDEIRRQTVRAMEREIGGDIECEVRRTRRGEDVRINHGIRIHEEFRRLMPALEALGFDVWVVSATNQWTVETFAERAFDVPRERVLGNRVCMGDDGVLGDETCQPVLYRQGKVDIIAQEIGAQPALVFGDSFTDFEMMCHASELAVLIDRGNDELRREAIERSFAIQPQERLTCSSEWGGASFQ
ncbi:HAD family hydrolase [Persicimonas caeni]|uniref:HAD family hydrolase n=1 Tax=Persicimonas caeni TaxID=2292766 RepID=UPI00143E039D|nr:haloacid dehalogenase-like hydrolase [Persicimonas caeni]